MNALDQLPDDVRRSLVERAARGDYQVLLGAGASCDSTDQSGSSLPLADELTNRLHLMSSQATKVSLGATYERAVKRLGGEAALQRRIKDWFQNTEPAAWYSDFVGLVWRRIWTLNIDDVIEQAYRKFSSDSWQTLQTVAWDDPFEEGSGLQVVHLHGVLREPLPQRLVFSILQYLNAREEAHAWHRAFGDYWLGAPTIVVGASLFEEYDLAEVFRGRPIPTELGSIYVSPKVDGDSASDLHDWGLHAVESSAAMFFRELHEAVAPRRSVVARFWTKQDVPAGILATFAQSWRHLQPQATTLMPAGHDFIQGSPPLWSDICSGLDAVLPWHIELNRRIDNTFASSPCQTVHLAMAPRLSGLSSGLLRLASLQLAQERDCFIFRGESRFDVYATLRYLEKSGPTVLFVDGCADFADDLNRLCEEANSRNIHAVIVAAEADVRREVVIGSIRDQFLMDHAEGSSADVGIVPLKRDAARSLVQHLDKLGRNGRIAGWTFSKRCQLFEKYGLFSGMAQVEYGNGFRHIMRQELEAIDDESARSVVLLAGLLHTVGYGMPLFLTSSSGLSVAQVRDRLRHDRALSALIRVEEPWLYARQRRLVVQPALEVVGQRRTRSLLLRVMLDLRPYVNPRSQRERALPVRIVGGLMRAKALRGWIGLESVPGFYDELAGSWSDNSRFWEQRAIAAQLLGQWAPAESFARRATDLSPSDSYRLNTLGSILLKRAQLDISLSSDQAEELYLDGRRQLRRALDLQAENPVPLLTFLEWGLAALEQPGRLERVRIQSHWQQFWRDAISHAALQQHQEQQALQRDREVFLRRAITA